MRRQTWMCGLMLLAPISLTRAGLLSGTGLVGSGEAVATADVGHMVTADYVTRSDYTFDFLYGSKDITDGSDFASVLRAFDTWTSLPEADLTYRYRPSRATANLGGTNGRNDITWVSAGQFGADAWTDVLGFSQRSIAVTVTWYYPDTRQISERDIYFNDIHMSWRTDTDGVEQGGYLVEHIALHEIGHIYGLRDVYNPGQGGYASWMGSGNEGLTMYAYTTWWSDDVTLSATDILAVASAHPGVVPEPATLALLALGAILLRREQPLCT
jgi:hypothetical protein